MCGRFTLSRQEGRELAMLRGADEDDLRELPATLQHCANARSLRDPLQVRKQNPLGVLGSCEQLDHQ
jgi:hypothetical protein